MGYEIPGGMGVKLAAPDREVFVMVGDGSYLMMASELVTAVQEDIKIIAVLVQNHGFASIGALSESLGSQRYGTAYRRRNTATGRLDGDKLPIDLAANAESLGAQVLRVSSIDELHQALRKAKSDARGPVVIHVETDPLLGAPDAATQDRLAQRVVAEGISVRALEELVALGESLADDQPRRQYAKATAPGLTDISDRLADRLDTRVKVTVGKSKGKVAIEFATLEDLQRIVDLIDPRNRMDRPI
jgi:TPP-dependent trihydroxycyclohexane-1,2-dione (THcHDO) dehydratase